MSERRETTIAVTVRERSTEEQITQAIRTRIRPWFDAIEAEGLAYSPPVFVLDPDPVDPWTTKVHVSTDVQPAAETPGGDA